MITVGAQVPGGPSAAQRTTRKAVGDPMFQDYRTTLSGEMPPISHFKLDKGLG
jgi:hypothetical protein